MIDLSDFGRIDIHLFDQLLNGRIARGMRVLDAGCGGGRNLQYLLRARHDVYGADESAESIASVRQMAAALAPTLPADHFRVEPVGAMTAGLRRSARDDRHRRRRPTLASSSASE